MNDKKTSIAEVLNFVNSFHEQCRNMVRDAVRLLRDDHQIFLSHGKTWDYTNKPNDRFLDQDYSMIRRTWSIFIPSGEIVRGACFNFEFFRPNYQMSPALIYGAASPGNKGFSELGRWTHFYTTEDAEKGGQNIKLDQDGPIAVVTGTMPRQFEESAFVRVPLEAITDQGALLRMVVSPLAALLKGNRSEAIQLLSNVPTELWPSGQPAVETDEQNDSETA